MLTLLKVGVAASVISFASWLSGRRPELAGFIVALPLTSMLALVFSYMEFKDLQATTVFAKSILVAVPVSLLFFVPFFFAERIAIGFWGSFGLGLLCLLGGYGIHREIMRFLA